MRSWVCLDAGIALKLVLKEADSPQARNLWENLIRNEQQPVAPRLFTFEITAVLRKLVYQGKITEAYGQAALNHLLQLNVQLLTIPDIHIHAWKLATTLNRPTAYDAHYLALAHSLECNFWTADKRLYNAAHPYLPWIKYLGNFN